MIHERLEKKGLDMDILSQITQEQIRTDLPALEIGDTVKVYVKVKEGTEKEFRCLRVPSLKRTTVVYRKHLQ